MFKKFTSNILFFVLICSVWTGIFFILPDFIDNPVNGISDFIVVVAYCGVVTLASYFLIYLFSINKYIFSIFFPLFSLLGSIIGFYRYTFKASLTPMLIDAVFNNDIGTSLDLISVELIIFVLISLIISIILIVYRFKMVIVKMQIVHLMFALIGITMSFSVSSRIKRSLFQRFPYNVYYSLSEYSKHQKLIHNGKIDFESEFRFTSNTSDSLIVVLILGESARSDHFSLNGYERNTNQLLSKRNNIYSFPNVFSEYTHTVRSLPHILTRADSVNENRAFSEKSFISLFNKSGYRTEWISNQDPADSYVYFMNECDTIIYANPEKNVYNYSNWYDTDLNPFVEKSLLKNYKNNLLILHSIGSHWYYNNHYPKEFEIYTPVTQSRIITKNVKEEIVNSYDNTILMTDFFIDQLIDILYDKNALLIYISDHGECLGEDGLWLHASDHATLKNPASLVWMSDKYIKMYPDKKVALEENQNKRWRTDFVFHSILSGANIPSISIHKDLDIFSIVEE